MINQGQQQDPLEKSTPRWRWCLTETNEHSVFASSVVYRALLTTSGWRPVQGKWLKSSDDRSRIIQLTRRRDSWFTDGLKVKVLTSFCHSYWDWDPFERMFFCSLKLNFSFWPSSSQQRDISSRSVVELFSSKKRVCTLNQNVNEIKRAAISC